MRELPRIGPGEFAAQLEAGGSAELWYRLVLPSGSEPAQVAERLAEEMHVVLGQTVACFDAATGPSDLVKHLRQAGNRPVLLFGLEGYAEADWRHMDLLRSQMVGGSAKVLIVSPAVVAKMENWAPNLTSFMGGAMWQLDPSADYLSADEREGRLQALRVARQRSDEDVIALAERGELPPDPDFAEWLVLLGRGELL